MHVVARAHRKPAVSALNASDGKLDGAATRSSAVGVPVSIHAMSLRRSQAPVEVVTVPQEHAAQVALGQQACQTSLLLPREDDGAPLDPQFASMLFDVSSGVRLIALASSPDIARRALTVARAEQMQHVEVRRLAYRRSELGRLLDRQFTEHAFLLRVADLTRANQDALKTYHWPGDFDELREIAAAIVAHATLGGLRPAAGSLGISHHKLARRFERVDLEIPLFDRDE